MSEATPRPQAPIDPEAILDGLESASVPEQIDSLESLLGVLNKKLSTAQG